MKKNKKQQDGKKRGRRYVKGFLCGAFTAATLLAGMGTVADMAVMPPQAAVEQGVTISSQQQKEVARSVQAAMRAVRHGHKAATDVLTLTPRQSTVMPTAIHAFGGVARTNSIRFSNWTAMLRRQKLYMQNPQNEKKYADYLDGFKVYAHAPLRRMAEQVNGNVRDHISYSDTLFQNSSIYWAAPVQTVLNGAGDCKAYAILQYAIMRHLGVPENRLVIAFVNARGLHDVTDHAVLLVNVAKKGAKQEFVVMNDGGPVLDAKLYTRRHGADSEWMFPYVFFDAVNEKGTWITPLEKKILYPAPPTPRGKVRTVSKRSLS